MGGWEKLFTIFIVGVNPAAAGERERRANPTAAGERGLVESPPHEALSWSLQFSPHWLNLGAQTITLTKADPILLPTGDQKYIYTWMCQERRNGGRRMSGGPT